MIQVPSELLMLSNEAVILCQGGLIVFANGSAMEVIGKDCIGKSSLSVFGAEVSEAQVSYFVSDMPINGKHYILRISKHDGLQAVMFSNQPELPEVLNDAFICSMRNYLMNISISTNIIRERVEAMGDEKSLESLASLTRGYFGIFRLMNNAIAVRDLFTGDLPYAPQVLNFSTLCSRMVSIIRELNHGCGYSLNLGDDVLLYGDPSLITLLLSNLLSNCLLHAKGLTRIAMSVIDSPGSVILSIDDDGCGIPQDELYSVLDRYQHGFDLARMGGGAGLGLTIARGIAAMHGGTLLLESKEGRGTTVRVSFMKDVSMNLTMKAQQPEYDTGMERFLTDFADCLSSRLYSERFLD